MGAGHGVMGGGYGVGRRTEDSRLRGKDVMGAGHDGVGVGMTGWVWDTV